MGPGSDTHLTAWNNTGLPDLFIFQQKFQKEFMYGGHLFALGAICVVYMCAVLSSIPITWDFMALVYLIFYCIYLYDYSSGAEEDLINNIDRSEYLQEEKNSKKIAFTLYASILTVAAIYVVKSDIVNMLVGFSVLTLGVLYHPYFKHLTKVIPAFKNIFVSAVWSLLAIFLFMYYSYPITPTALVLAAFVFLRMLTIQIVFDMRDVEGDKKNGLLTVPLLFKENDSIILNLLNIMTIGVLIYGIYMGIVPATSIMMLFVFFYAYSYIKNVHLGRSEKTNYFNAAAEPIVWALLIQSGHLCIDVLQTSAQFL
ncbi:4-hydroxybenzoate polyprenyltransferase [Methanohalophilus levihalophilus]|uniref:UbiA family prenyltransferase n=1 Tax=Methanohalophilus levihalophilus TaxID=1431282 RepID=UPI001AEAFFF7|nr:UbiA family prenyltransferase [Methanohalophilus levihalophilus]MBP2029627.1 4-hydroxybenzoate polyprenyltransferase [Methanohalophilus levihalophilus]